MVKGRERRFIIWLGKCCGKALQLIFSHEEDEVDMSFSF
jgi:hypothetical protein